MKKLAAVFLLLPLSCVFLLNFVKSTDIKKNVTRHTGCLVIFNEKVNAATEHKIVKCAPHEEDITHEIYKVSDSSGSAIMHILNLRGISKQDCSKLEDTSDVQQADYYTTNKLNDWQDKGCLITNLGDVENSYLKLTFENELMIKGKLKTSSYTYYVVSNKNCSEIKDKHNKDGANLLDFEKLDK